MPGGVSCLHVAYVNCMLPSLCFSPPVIVELFLSCSQFSEVLVEALYMLMNALKPVSLKGPTTIPPHVMFY